MNTLILMTSILLSNPAHQSTTYSCELTPVECHLVDSAAYWLTQRGYPTVRASVDVATIHVIGAAERRGWGAYGALQFGPRTGALYGLGAMEMWERVPVMKRTGNIIEVTAKPGVIRDGDLVSSYMDLLRAGR
jgi:hypothetical protein